MVTAPMQDYSRATPGVQTLHAEAFDQYLLSYGSGLAVFDRLEDMKIIIDASPEAEATVGLDTINYI